MEKIFVEAHKALHNPKQEKLNVNGTSTKIKTNTKNLRYVIIKVENREWDVIQQDPTTRSGYAKRAMEGEQISWLIPHQYGSRKQDGWKVITNSTPIN